MEKYWRRDQRMWKRLIQQNLVERATGIEPVSEAWEASVLPLY